jgi:hypothetical protein
MSIIGIVTLLSSLWDIFVLIALCHENLDQQQRVNLSSLEEIMLMNHSECFSSLRKKILYWEGECKKSMGSWYQYDNCFRN